MDAGQIKQALVNLIKNAMQAMTRGGTLTVETGQNTEEVWVSVADTGGGIAPDQVNLIFEPFYTTKKKGTGPGVDDRAAHRAPAWRAHRTGEPGRAGDDLPHLAAARRERQQKLLR
jgi:hypothetical protein